MDAHRITLTIVAVHLVVAAFASVAVLRDYTISISQKLGQVVVALVIPILGPLGILCFLVSAHTREELREILPFPFYLLAVDAVEENRRRERGYDINKHMQGD